LDEPRSQRSDEHCEESRHNLVGRQDPTSALEVVGAAQRLIAKLRPTRILSLASHLRGS
jgi:hypothetical protein